MASTKGNPRKTGRNPKGIDPSNPFIAVIPPKPESYHAPDEAELEKLATDTAKHTGETAEEVRIRRGLGPSTGGGSTPGRVGRPPLEQSLTALLKRKMTALSPDERRTWAEALSDKLLKLALSGNMFAMTEVINRIDGRLTETHKVETDGRVILNFVPVMPPSTVVAIDAPSCKELPQGEQLEQD